MNQPPTLPSLVKIKLLVMVAMADGKCDERELKTLQLLAVKLGVDETELESIRAHPDLNLQELQKGLPKDNAGRIDLLADLMRVAFADRVVDKHELALLTRLGKALGFEADEVKVIAEEM